MEDELRDMIVRIDARTEALVDAQEKRDLVIDKRLDNHASRLSLLEKWQAGVAMLSSGVAVAVGLAVKFFK
jgi:hypothetical protein